MGRGMEPSSSIPHYLTVQKSYVLCYLHFDVAHSIQQIFLQLISLIFWNFRSALYVHRFFSFRSWTRYIPFIPYQKLQKCGIALALCNNLQNGLQIYFKHWDECNTRKRVHSINYLGQSTNIAVCWLRNGCHEDRGVCNGLQLSNIRVLKS